MLNITIIDSARFMESSLSNLVNNLAEGIHVKVNMILNVKV